MKPFDEWWESEGQYLPLNPLDTARDAWDKAWELASKCKLAVEVLYPGDRYGNPTDRHIYHIKDGAQTPRDWLRVACAALDQAGCTKDFADRFYDEAKKHLNYPD